VDLQSADLEHRAWSCFTGGLKHRNYMPCCVRSYSVWDWFVEVLRTDLNGSLDVVSRVNNEWYFDVWHLYKITAIMPVGNFPTVVYCVT